MIDVVLIAVFLAWLLIKGQERNAGSSIQPSPSAPIAASAADYMPGDSLTPEQLSFLAQLATPQDWAAAYQTTPGIPVPLAPARPN